MPDCFVDYNSKIVQFLSSASKQAQETVDSTEPLPKWFRVDLGLAIAAIFNSVAQKVDFVAIVGANLASSSIHIQPI